jgi:hypothetical protein
MCAVLACNWWRVLLVFRLRGQHTRAAPMGGLPGAA